MSKFKNLLLALIVIPSLLFFTSCGNSTQENSNTEKSASIETENSKNIENSSSDDSKNQNSSEGEAKTSDTDNSNTASGSDLDTIYKNLKAYSGKPYAVVNNNVPTFTRADLSLKNGSFDRFTQLDSLGRCGQADAMVGRDIMPTEKRGPIGMVKPTGWKLAKYDNVDGKYLYNRCHLIGFQLTGQNANELNLITGTRYLNVDGMLPFENEIADYVKRTKNHVRYRVTPYFVGNELVARGVFMQARSIEDNGKGVSFNIFAYNVQPDIKIDYNTGESYDKNGNSGTVKRVNQDKTNYKNSNSKNYQKQSQSSKKEVKPTSQKPIKGNINSKGEKIYHVPGGAFYEKTKAEETFATEQDAINAGYRASKR